MAASPSGPDLPVRLQLQSRQPGLADADLEASVRDTHARQPVGQAADVGEQPSARRHALFLSAWRFVLRSIHDSSRLSVTPYMSRSISRQM